jgi:hypothetical protein
MFADRMPRRDLIAAIERYETWDSPTPLYRLWVYSHEIGLYGSLDSARFAGEAEVGERLRWEQVSRTRHEAWSHRV